MNATAIGSPPQFANPWLSHSVVIDDITPEIPGVATYHLRFTDDKLQSEYRFRPGQFNMLYLPGVGEVAISVSDDSARRGGTVAHTIRVAGSVTGVLAKLGRGGSLGLRGPYGTCWPLDQSRGADVIFVAGGIGLAPLRPAVYEVLAHRSEFGRAVLLYGSRSPDTLLYPKEFADWSRRGLEIKITVDRAAPGWTGHVGVVPLLLQRLRPLNPANTVLLTCGPEIMMDYSLRAGLERGLSPQRMWLSMERNMQCAVGLCGHCQFGPTFVCKDGPVFRYDVLEPFLRVKEL